MGLGAVPEFVWQLSARGLARQSDSCDRRSAPSRNGQFPPNPITAPFKAGLVLVVASQPAPVAESGWPENAASAVKLRVLIPGARAKTTAVAGMLLANRRPSHGCRTGRQEEASPSGIRMLQSASQQRSSDGHGATLHVNYQVAMRLGDQDWGLWRFFCS